MTFAGVATDDNTCSVFVNGHIAMRSGDNFLVTVLLEEGVNPITVMATDLAGNIARYTPFDVLIDTTPPETLNISADPAGWTNTRPYIHFEAVDNGIGMNHCELSINGQNYLNPVTSPFRLPFLGEGENTIAVKAMDCMSNTRIEEVTVYIDTVAPEAPSNFRAIPGDDSMEVRWTEMDEEVVGYVLTTDNGDKIEFSRDDGTEWNEDGLEFSWKEDGLNAGQSKNFSLYSIDHAGNRSDEIEIEGTVAMAEVECLPDSPTVVEYEDILVAVAKESVPEEVAAIKMIRIEDEILSDFAANPVVSPIYRFYGESDTGEEVSHINFSEPFVGQIEYSESDLPEGVSEENLQVYYFDNFWCTWFALEDCLVDTENNEIVFSTDHFTDFAVQATTSESLSSEELTSIEYSNFTGAVSHDPLNVSPQVGSLSTSMTDLVLPGKNGFDFTIRRLYNTSIARDNGRYGSTDIADGKSTDNHGSFLPEMSFGQGWQLDLPHLKYTNSSVFLAVPGGSYYDLNSLEQKGDPVKISSHKFEVTYENHDGNDFSYVMTRKRDSRYENGTGTIYYTIVSSILYMKDGTSYHFNGKGKLTEIKDPTGAMSIQIVYTDDNLIEKIIDSLGREILFTYDSVVDGNSTNYFIKTINVFGSERTITYEYDTAYNGLNLTIPLLKSAWESAERKWSYVYQEEILLSESGSYISEEMDEYLKSQFQEKYSKIADPVGTGNDFKYGFRTLDHLFLLNGLSGPGVGSETVTYEIQKLKKSYKGGLFNLKKKNHKYDHFPTVSTYSRANDLGAAADYTATYTYDFDTFKDNGFQYRNDGTIINDGKLLTTYDFDKVEKKSHRTIMRDRCDSIGEFNMDRVVDSIYFTSVNETIEYTKVIDSSFLEKKTYSYDDRERLISERYEKSDSYYTETTYAYDDWSNYASIDEKEVSGDITITRNTENSYSPVDSHVSTKPYIHDLLYQSIVTGNYTKGTDETITSPTETTQFDYNSYGQRVSVRQKTDDDTWAETEYTYYPAKEVNKGALKSITSPTGHVTSFTYVYFEESGDYTGDYSITQKEEDVKKVDGTTYSFDTKKIYDFHTGNLIYFRDGEQNITTYGYDAYGRKTSEIKPKDIGENEVKIVISYDDALLTTTHTDAMGAVTVYTFNKRGQLEQIDKKRRAVTEITGDVASVSTTKLTYDGLGNIASITDPARLKISYGYDELQRLVSEKYSDSTDLSAEPAYTEKSYDYNDAANSRTTTRENGTTVYEAYDMSGNVIQEIIGGVKSASYVYDNQDRLIRKVNGNGQVSTYTYDTRGNLKTETLPAVEGFDGTSIISSVSLVKKYSYDESGNRTKEVYYQGTEDTAIELKNRDFKYDGMGQVIEEIDHYIKDNIDTASSVKYAYNCNGQVLSVTDTNNVSTVKTYTSRGQISTETFGGYTTVYDYDLEDRLVKMSDPRKGLYEGDFSVEYVYDDLDRLVKGELPDRDGQTPAVVLAYDARGNLSSRTEPDGSLTSYTYTYRNWVFEETKTGDNGSYKTEYGYDAAGNRTSVTEPNTAEWVYAYDGADRLITVTQPLGSVIHYTYDGEDNLTGKTNGSGFWSYYTYDARGRLATEKDALGNITSYAYDILGNRTRMTDPNLNEWKYQYDEMGRMVQETNSRNLNAYYTYDAGGRLKTLTDPNGTVVTYAYNNRNLPTAVGYVNTLLGKSQSESFTYDEAGSVKTATLDGVTKRYNHFYNEETKVWEYNPDPYGLVEASDVSFGGESYRTEYGFDKMNRMNKLTYSQGHSMTQEWGKLGQIKSIAGYASDFTYDDMGRMDGYKQNNGVVVDYGYDDKSRLNKLNYSMSGTEYLNYDYTYDLSDNMTGRNEDYFGYDRKDQLSCSYLKWLSSETEFPVKNFNLMDKQDDVIGEEAAEGFYFTSDSNATSGYDAITGSVSLDYAASSLVVDYAYPYRMKRVTVLPENADHRIDPDKLAVYTAMYNEDRFYSEQVDAKIIRDEATGQLTIIFDEPVFGRFVKIHCHYNEMDGEGNPLTTFADFSFDGRSDVTAVAMVSGRNEYYGYDGKGNRSTRYLMLERDYPDTYTRMADSDLLKTDGTYGYEYDNNGNLIRKSTRFDINTGKVKNPAELDDIDPDTYEYFEYEWDLKNRLVSVKSYDFDTKVVENIARYLYDIDGYRVEKENRDGKKTHYVFNMSGKVLEEIDKESGEVITSVFLKNRHLARVTADETLYYGTDHQGSTVLMTNASGEKVWSSEATPFGDAVVKKTDDYYDVDLKYTGKDLDEDTGLYYYNARWYDAETGRFVSEDPARDGQNWFIYVSNNPLKFVDPTGMTTEDELDEMTRDAINDRENRRDTMRENRRAERQLRRAERNYQRAQNANTWLGRSFWSSRADMQQRFGNQHIQNNLNRGRQVSDSAYEAWGDAFNSMMELYGEQGESSTGVANSNEYNLGYLLQDAMPFGPGDQACYFRTYQGMAERYLDSYLSSRDLAASYFSLLRAGAITSDYIVNDQIAVLNDALMRLGRSDLEAVKLGTGLYGMPTPDGTDYTRLVGNQLRYPDDYRKSHAVLGDSHGIPIWDPAHGDVVPSRTYRGWEAYDIRQREYSSLYYRGLQ